MDQRVAAVPKRNGQRLPAIFPDCAEAAADSVNPVRIIIRHAIGIVDDLCRAHCRDIRDFRSMLNFALEGSHHTLWIRVGDGEIMQGRARKLVVYHRDAVSRQVGVWLEQLRQEKLRASELRKRFYSDAFNHQSTGDDRSIAL